MVIFKCLWSKAINIEVVTSADAKSFIIAFSNHIFSFGIPSKIFSDAESNIQSAFNYVENVL